MAELNSLGGLSISLTTLCLVGLYALWFVRSALKKNQPTEAGPRASRWLMLYLGAVFLSVFVASDRMLAVYELVMLTQIFLLYFYIVKTVRSEKDVRYVVVVLILGMLLQACLVIGLRGIGHNIELGPLVARIDSNMRVAGTIGSPNTAGGYFGSLLAASLALYLSEKGNWRWLGLLAFFLASIALVLTYSRGGWLAGAGSLSLFCWFAWRRGWLSPRLPMVLGLSAIFLLGLFYESIAERLLGQESATLGDRMVMNDLAFRMATDHPFLGVGANNFAVAMSDYIVFPDFTGEWLHTVHNKYILVWTENGLFGLIGFIGFLFGIIYSGWCAWTRGNRSMAMIGLAFTGIVIGQMLHMNFAIYHGRSKVQFLWLVAGLLTSISWQVCHPVKERSSAQEGDEPDRLGPALGLQPS